MIERRLCACLLVASGCSWVEPTVTRRVSGVTMPGRFVSDSAYAAGFHAEVARANGDHEAEVRWLEQAVRLDPASGDLQSRLGLAKCRLNQDAEADFREAEKKEPLFRPTFARWAECAELRGEKRRAEQLRARGHIVVLPHAPSPHRSSLADAQTIDEARAIGRREGLSGTRLALRLLELGKLALALEETQAQLRADPNDPDAYALLIAIADATGNESLLFGIAWPRGRASAEFQAVVHATLSRRLEARGLAW